MYNQDLNKVLQKWEIILREKFNKKPEKALEVFLLLATAHMYGIANPN